MHDLDIIKIDECLEAKNLLTNVTKTNEHSNVVTFVRALSRILENGFTSVFKSTKILVLYRSLTAIDIHL